MKVTKEKKSRQGKRIQGSKISFLGKREGCVYINKGTRYREKIGCWGRYKNDLKKEDNFLKLGEKIWRMDFHRS